MVNRPVVSSMRSRQTGQVGSSTKAGVGGARGFVESGAEERGLDWTDAVRWGALDESGFKSALC